MAVREQQDPAVAALMAHSAAWNTVRGTKDPMSDCNAEPDEYYGQVSDATLKISSSDGTPMATINIPIICNTKGDQTFAGENAKLFHYFKPTDDNPMIRIMERFVWDLEKLNISTSNMDIRDIKKKLEEVKAGRAYVHIAITRGTKDPSKKYVNLRGIVAKEKIEEVLGAVLDGPPVESGVTASGNQLHYSEEAGLWYDAAGNWYNSDGQLLDADGNVASADAGSADGYQEYTEPAPSSAPPAPPARPTTPSASPRSAAPAPPRPTAPAAPKAQAPASAASTRRVPPPPPARR